MATLTLAQANTVVAATFAEAQRLRLKPLAVVVLDCSGLERTVQVQDGASPLRAKIAHGKAFGAVGLGIGSRAIMLRAESQPWFVNAVNGLARGALVPVPGGVLIRGSSGETLGAIGVSGDTSENDEAVAIVGIAAAGLTPDPG